MEQFVEKAVAFAIENKWYLIGGLSTLVVLNILF